MRLFEQNKGGLLSGQLPEPEQVLKFPTNNVIWQHFQESRSEA